MSELRWHPLLEEWVAFATHRQVRPIALGATGSCPFCQGGAEGLNAPYEFAVFENRFPSFDTGTGGTCEVVLYSDRHDTTLAEASREHVDKLIQVWTDRYRELSARPDVKYVYIFENKGAVIGVTLSHPHGQIYAFPFIPPRIKTRLTAERRYRRKHRRCLGCALLREELRTRSRLVDLNRGFAAYVPPFARYPYEVHVSPRRHLGHLGEMTAGERWDLAGILKSVLGRYDRLYGFSFPYIMLMHSTPSDGRKHAEHHFLIEFYPPHRSRDKIKYLAGCESGAGTFINDTLPEEKAAELRRA